MIDDLRHLPPQFGFDLSPRFSCRRVSLQFRKTPTRFGGAIIDIGEDNRQRVHEIRAEDSPLILREIRGVLLNFGSVHA
jgi:hypothetical protein